MKIDIIAVGNLRKGPLFSLYQEYEKRIQWKLKLHETDESKIPGLLKSSAFVVALDERGETLSSQNFSKKIEQLQNQGQSHLQFIIGGADGLSDDVRAKSNLLLSFGKQTWPHMLARVMLLEQIYRAQQIIAGHPYHRE